jgi:zinc and cadmium transporter
MTFFLIIISTIIISLLSLLLAFGVSKVIDRIPKLGYILISLSAGTLVGGAFLHLLPESMELLDIEVASITVMISILLLLGIEKVLSWRHCHKDNCDVHSFGYMNLIGDGIHNFLDGLVIASAFMISPQIGLITTLAIALHEIPQELGDFGVLIYAGFTRKRALLLNLLISTTAILGGILGYALIGAFEGITGYILAFATGSFIYISTSDLIPEVRSNENKLDIIISFGTILSGVILMYLLTFIEIH